MEFCGFASWESSCKWESQGWIVRTAELVFPPTDAAIVAVDLDLVTAVLI